MCWKVDNFGVIYKGCAIVGNTLMIANWSAGEVERYDTFFGLQGMFTDPDTLLTDNGWSPYNVTTVDTGGSAYVCFAFNTGERNPVAGVGNGFITVFGEDGSYIRRFVFGRPLNIPWGILPIAYPGLDPNFPTEELAVVNASGELQRFEKTTGNFLGPIHDAAGNEIALGGALAAVIVLTPNLPVGAMALLSAAFLEGFAGKIVAAEFSTRIEQD